MYEGINGDDVTYLFSTKVGRPIKIKTLYNTKIIWYKS